MRGKRLLCGLAVAIILLHPSTLCAAAPATNPARKPQDLDTDKLADVPVNEREAEYYPMIDVPMPSDGVMEAGSILMLPDGRLAVGTRRGEIYLATGAETHPPKPVWKLIASAQTEIFGLAYRDGAFYATQQSEITRIRDTKGSGKADRYETVSDAWAWGG